MQKTQCRECQGTELYDTVLSARNGVIIGRKTRTGDEWILVRCLVCLNCGNISPFLDDMGVQRLRSWAYSGEAPTPLAMSADDPAAAPPSAPDDPANPPPQTSKSGGFGTIVIFCLILGTLLGIAVAVYGITHE